MFVDYCPFLHSLLAQLTLTSDIQTCFILFLFRVVATFVREVGTLEKNPDITRASTG